MKNLPIQMVTDHCLRLLDAFNKKDGNACARLYDAVAMVRSPEQQFIIGKQDIALFWSSLIDTKHTKAGLAEVSLISALTDYFVSHAIWTFADGSKLELKETWCEAENSFQIIEQRINWQEFNEEVTPKKCKPNWSRRHLYTVDGFNPVSGLAV